jgi:acetyl/propionyl-CoA carboxylase alpha subunit
MIAKVIVWAPDRGTAIRLAKRTLAATTVLGVGTNQEFLGRCLSHPGFLDKNYTTGFIENYRSDLFHYIEEDYERLAAQISLFLKYCADMERKISKNGAFRSIGSNFRIQSMDKSNVKGDHIIIGNKAFIVQYSPHRDDKFETVQVWQVQEEKITEKQKKRFLNKAGGALVQRYYSAMLGRENVRTMEISIVHAKVQRRGTAWDEWIEGDVTFQIDGAVKTEYLATEGDWRNRDDVAQIVWLHAPELCAGVKGVRRNLLAFAGRLDERSSGSAAELGITFLSWR